MFRKIAALLLVPLLTSVGVSATSAHEVDLAALPLNDGYLTSGPRVGSIYACQSRFNPNAPGAQRSGDWIDEGAGTFDLTEKPVVDGAVSHVSELHLAISGDRRIITGNALPDHLTGKFPVSRSDDAYYYDRNPNSISAHQFSALLPLEPQIADQAACVPMGAIGIMLTGAVLFNALDARGKNALAHEILDRCQGHPEGSGLYHYHGQSPCQEDPAPGMEHSGLVGYAFDGFGVYGYRGEGGVVLHTNDLDACHGHIGQVSFNGEARTIYHYHATMDYPYTVSCFRGTPVTVSDLAQSRPGPRGAGGHRRRDDRFRPPPRL